MRVVIINGPSAVGKTMLANKLHLLLDQPAVRINIDEIRHMISQRKTFPEISYPLALKLAKGALEESLQDGRDVIIDKMLFDEPSYGEIGYALDVYRGIAQKYGADMYEFILIADQNVLMARAEKRGFSTDKSLTPETAVQFLHSMNAFAKDRTEAILIDTSQFDENQVLGKVCDIIGIEKNKD